MLVAPGVTRGVKQKVVSPVGAAGVVQNIIKDDLKDNVEECQCS
jgi:hypothetical protein